MMTDPIADMLTRIRNANMCRKESVDIPLSKVKLGIARILEEQGYIETYATVSQSSVKDTLRIKLKGLNKGESVIHYLQRVSKPSRRVYVKASEITETCGGLGISIISTSKGLMTGKEARRRNLGGEIVCRVW